jgi:hypothetical protein
MHDTYLSGEEVTDFTASSVDTRRLEEQEDAVAAKTQPKQHE